MPIILNSHDKDLKLPGKVKLPKGKETQVAKEAWQKCKAHPITQSIMAKGMIKVVMNAKEAAPKAKLAPKPAPKEAKTSAK